jgi:Lrp/AsnC family transcriptional regulator for asnA, asnC and gidA
MKIDETDKKIIAVLKKHAKKTVSELSRIVRLPLTTVHNRIKKLEKEGVIRDYTVVLDYQKLGKEIAAYVLLTVDYKTLQAHGISQQGLAAQLKKLNSVEEVAMITGNQDILVKVRVANVAELNNFVTEDLRNVQGIEKTQTMLILQEI